ncbi:MAG: hypothetical protein Q4C61_11780, partial [Lachnospiraceae bacterium]|nr:hypothetical protein [Lachnospiraceae bacterium]
EYTFTTEDLTVPEGYRCVEEFSQTVAYGDHVQVSVTVELEKVEDKAATLTVKYWNGTEYLPGEVLVSPITGHDAYYQFDIPTELKQIPEGYEVADKTVRAVLVPYGETMEAVVAVKSIVKDEAATLTVKYWNGTEYLPSEVLVSPITGHDAYYQFDIPTELKQIPAGYKLTDTTVRPVLVPYGETREAVVAVVRENEEPVDANALLRVIYKDGDEIVWTEHVVSEEKGHEGTYEFKVPADLADVPDGYEVADAEEYTVEVAYGDVEEIEVAVTKAVKDEAATLTVKYWNGTEYLPEEVLVSPITGHDAYYQFDIPTELKQIPEGYELTDTTVRPVLVPYGETKTAVVAVRSIVKDEAATLTVKYWNGTEYLPEEVLVSPITGHDAYYQFDIPTDLKKIPEGYRLTDTTVRPVLVPYGEAKTAVVAVTKEGGEPVDANALLRVIYKSGDEIVWTEHVVSREKGHEGTYEFKVPADLADVPDGYEVADAEEYTVEVAYGNVKEIEVAVKKAVKDEAATLTVKYWNGTEYLPEEVLVSPITGHDAYYQFDIPTDLKQIPEGYKLTDTTVRPVLVPYGETRQAVVAVEKIPAETETPSTETPVTETPSTETPST